MRYLIYVYFVSLFPDGPVGDILYLFFSWREGPLCSKHPGKLQKATITKLIPTSWVSRQTANLPLFPKKVCLQYKQQVRGWMGPSTGSHSWRPCPCPQRLHETLLIFRRMDEAPCTGGLIDGGTGSLPASGREWVSWLPSSHDGREGQRRIYEKTARVSFEALNPEALNQGKDKG